MRVSAKVTRSRPLICFPERLQLIQKGFTLISMNDDETYVSGTPIFLKICRELDLLKMAGNSPHGGGFSGAGDDFDPMTLPPRTRPFIPGRYNPPAHVLPRAVFRHFTSFDERAPEDLLLREPEHHLSHEARELVPVACGVWLHHRAGLPSRGYMEEVVGLVATLEGMVLRREAQLSVAGIQMPTWSGQPQARPPGPHWGAGPSGPYQGEGSSRPSRGAGPSRPFRGARGGPVRRRRAHVVEVESDEEEEEATDRQFETSVEEGGSGFGSGNRGEAEEGPEDDSSDSDDGVEVVPQKRTRRASRSRSRGF
ncbi:hypothetical protein TEA_017773 [Camellia sinensis var. sinensis]|uniref:Uncharacterized protein n=2 Tax=Camellia sinensis TaxID=4442 RepID=A0A4V3WLG7_CAMSN|nr:hypothetical protein TEA_017773 [Camellia sinensis var. sinensis]